MPNTVEDRVKSLIVDHMEIPVELVTLDASLIGKLGMDSLDTVELVIACEEEFGVKIPDSSWDDIITVKDAINAVSVEQMG